MHNWTYRAQNGTYKAQAALIVFAPHSDEGGRGGAGIMG